MNVSRFHYKTHIWRIKTLHPNTSVEYVSFCPSLVPVALHPPWFGLSVFYLRNFTDLFFYCPPIKVVELLKVIKESSSRPALISGCKKWFIEEKTDSETLNATRKITGETPESWPIRPQSNLLFGLNNSRHLFSFLSNREFFVFLVLNKIPIGFPFPPWAYWKIICWINQEYWIILNLMVKEKFSSCIFQLLSPRDAQLGRGIYCRHQEPSRQLQATS